MWVRVTGLTIEYYDKEALKFNGDRIGKTVKVDKATLAQEHGNYARICVQVDLMNPLVAMFMIKDHKYHVEYKGLHLLCVNCGRFRHYKDDCQDKICSTVEKDEVDAEQLNKE